MQELEVVVSRSETVLTYFQSRVVKNNKVLDVEAFEYMLDASELLEKLSTKKRESAQFLAITDDDLESRHAAVRLARKAVRAAQSAKICVYMLAVGTKRSRRSLERMFQEIEGRMPKREVVLPRPKSL